MTHKCQILIPISEGSCRERVGCAFICQETRDIDGHGVQDVSLMDKTEISLVALFGEESLDDEAFRKRSSLKTSSCRSRSRFLA